MDSLHHRHPKSPPVKPPETDESAEDEEVIRITSTPSSSGVPSSFTPSVFSAKHRVADSGIQQVRQLVGLSFVMVCGTVSE